MRTVVDEIASSGFGLLAGVTVIWGGGVLQRRRLSRLIMIDALVWGDSCGYTLADGPLPSSWCTNLWQ